MLYAPVHNVMVLTFEKDAQLIDQIQIFDHTSSHYITFTRFAFVIKL